MIDLIVLCLIGLVIYLLVLSGKNPPSQTLQRWNIFGVLLAGHRQKYTETYGNVAGALTVAE